MPAALLLIVLGAVSVQRPSIRRLPRPVRSITLLISTARLRLQSSLASIRLLPTPRRWWLRVRASSAIAFETAIRQT